ncbi:aquaporin-3-like isoform X3 [Hypanus sabinus]|uniref:aquaporin-3-like isoform X3 n=1 Tax=Hypanus sabinus TaxID=79690 RepID=UPI0028C46560|nr:aquaporin-3-like isoform X3 [Hypanus sabinus]
MGKQEEILRKVTLLLKVRSILVKQCLAECLGTLIHTMLSCGAIAQFTLSCGTHTEFLSVTFAIGFAVALGILVTSKVSGAHLNPAVTFALCLLACEPWLKFPFFFLAQTVGAFLGSGIMFGLYYEKLWLHGNKQLTVIGPNSTAGIFTTFPLEHAAGTAVLIFCILIIVDPLHTPVRTGLEAFTIGLVVLIIGWSMGSNSQYSLNPARDIGPRLFTAIAGWGSEVFTAGSYWFWIPLVSPIIGAVLGVLMYQFIVGLRVDARSGCSIKAEQNVKPLSLKTGGSC